MALRKVWPYLAGGVFLLFTLPGLTSASWLFTPSISGEPLDLAIDESSNVYVAGHTNYDSVTEYDYLIIKYNPVGETVWVREFDGGPVSNANEYAYALTIDPSGNILATGTSGTVKYAPSGDLLWHQPQADGIDVTTDADGNAYVVTEDYILKKYSSYGDSLWVNAQWYSPDSRATAVKLDGAGNVYVGGRRRQGERLDYFTTKYSPDGNYLWFRQIDSNNDLGDLVFGFQVDQQGNSYISISQGSYITLKHGPDGETLWSGTYPLSELGPWYNTNTVDQSGNVYMAGYYTYRGPLQEIITDHVIVKYSPSGDSLWVRRVYLATGAPFSVSEPHLAVDLDGSLYLAASALGNMAAFKFNGAGQLRSASIYDADSPENSVRAVAVGPSQDFYITGTLEDQYVTTLQYSCDGTIVTPGDANADNQLSLADIISNINYAFGKADWPPCLSNTNLCWLTDLFCRGDWNADGNVSLADVIRGVNYLFNKPGGPWNAVAPNNCCLPVQ